MDEDVTAGRDGRPERVGARYALVERLGQGGHGEVWTARDALTGARVAVKLLRPRTGTSHARVRREVAALRLLRIPGVVRLLDEGVEDAWVYLVMEHVPGRPFPGVEAPCAWERLEPTVMSLLDTLDRIHAAGVVHRDLKPENVLVTAEGAPVVLDFGIARAPVGDNITRQDEFVGTPAYTAPECVRCEEPTPCSDFFSLGVMLFEALSGEAPYPSGTRMQAMFSRVMGAARPLAEVAPTVPAAVARAVDAMLQRDPGERPGTAAQVKALLRGERWERDPDLLIPWIGGRAQVDAVVAALREGHPVEVVGAPGSGRTRMLREVEAALACEGRAVHWILPGRRPFSSLGALRPDVEATARATIDEVTAQSASRIREAMRGGAVFLIDGAERVDPATRAIFDGLAEGGVARAVIPSARRGERAVSLRPWTEEALRPLFEGVERLLHAPSDAARLLHQRTGGLASRVAAELGSWLRSGVVRRRGEAFLVEREALAQIAAGMRVRAPAKRIEHLQELPEVERDLLHGVSLAWPDATVEALARLTRRPAWEVEFDARALETRGLLRASHGRFEPLVDAWCDWSETRLAEAHRTLADALPTGTERRLFHLVASATDPEDAREIAREALAQAEALARGGALQAAVGVLDEGLRAVRRLAPDRTEEVGALLRAWTEVALLQETAQGLDRVLYALCREPRPPGAARWEALVRAALTLSSDGARALEMADALGVFDDPDLERRRLAVRVLASRSCAVEQERAVVLDAVARVASRDDPRDRAAAAGWLGRMHYREGRYDEAAAMQERAASLEPWEGLRVAALSRAASARMEGFHFDEAARLARETLRLAAQCRNTHYEALAEWVLRSVAYRTGEAEAPDEALIEAAARFGVRHIEALVCMTEAAIAWRAGDRARAAALVEVSLRNWSALGLKGNTLLARAFSAELGATLSPEARAALCEEARGCSIAGVGIQALALLAPGEGRAMEEAARALASQVPRAHWEKRIDVLSVRESLERLGLCYLQLPYWFGAETAESDACR